MRVAPPVVIDSSQKGILEQSARSRSLPARQVERAKVVLLAAALWTAAFVLFLAVYAPILFNPRVDGKPG